MGKYLIVDHTTTKKNNHLLEGKSSILLTNKIGDKISPIFENETVAYFATKPGTFCFTQIEDKIYLFQLFKIIRDIDEDVPYDTPIREVENSKVHYKGVWCILNTFDGNEWERPLINRLQKYEELVKSSYKEVYIDECEW